jgi:hypothetical protein
VRNSPPAATVKCKGKRRTHGPRVKRHPTALYGHQVACGNRSPSSSAPGGLAKDALWVQQIGEAEANGWRKDNRERVAVGGRDGGSQRVRGVRTDGSVKWAAVAASRGGRGESQARLKVVGVAQQSVAAEAAPRVSRGCW